MTSTSKQLIVGLVFFAILAVVGVFTILIRGINNPFDPPQDVVVYFKNGVGGLREGNVVRIAGLEIGQVEKMRLMPVGVLALLRVQKGVHLHPGYEIKVKAFSPLGGKYVDIQRGEQTMAPLDLQLATNDFWNLDPAQTVGYHTGAGSETRPLEGQVEAELIAELATLAENIRPDVEASIRNIRETTEKINESQGTIGKLVGDPTLFDAMRSAAENIDRATEDLARIMEKVNEGSGTVAKLVNDPRLYDTATASLERVQSIVTKVDEGRGPIGRLINSERVAEDLERSIASLEKVLAAAADEENPGTFGRFMQDPTLYDELTEAVTDLRTILATVESGRSPVGVLVMDEEAGASLKRTIENVEKTTLALSEPKGTIGRLIHDDRLINEAERVIVEVRESVEDLREQAPINAFVQAVFSAF